jgi:bis(5'-nucleosidyl)-tetraphosphatase
MNYRPAVFVLVYRKERNKVLYLILKRKLHWIGWEFPKGGIEIEETQMQAVLRELKEETNLSPIQIKNHNLSGKYRYPKFLKDRPNHLGQTYALFSAEVKQSKVKIDKKEHSGYKWMNFKNAIKILNWPDQKECLTLVNESLK